MCVGDAVSTMQIGMRPMAEIVGWASILLAIAAAGLGIYAGFFMEIRDSIDEIVGDLRLQSQYAAWAAAFAGGSAVLQAFERYLLK
jgi:hypothetical protein